MTETISRRDHFAVLILAGMAGNSAYRPNASSEALAELATMAIAQADELIKQLDKRDRVKSSDDYWAFDPKAKEDAINREADDA